MALQVLPHLPPPVLQPVVRPSLGHNTPQRSPTMYNTHRVELTGALILNLQQGRIIYAAHVLLADNFALLGSPPASSQTVESTDLKVFPKSLLHPPTDAHQIISTVIARHLVCLATRRKSRYFCLSARLWLSCRSAPSVASPLVGRGILRRLRSSLSKVTHSFHENPKLAFCQRVDVHTFRHSKFSSILLLRQFFLSSEYFPRALALRNLRAFSVTPKGST